MDTDEVIDVLTNRCNAQRATIREEYKSKIFIDLRLNQGLDRTTLLL